MVLRMLKSLETWFMKYLSIKRIIISVISLTILYNEFIVYWIHSSSWPTFPKVQRDKELVVLLVADPQIQGEDEDIGFPLDTLARWDADRYLYKTFELAYSYCTPDVVIFLGDLMDGGSQADHDEYERYFQRFHSDLYTGDNVIGGDIFIIETCRHVFIILGDLDTGENDIGGDLDTGDNVIGGDIFIIDTCRHVFIILHDLDTGDNVIGGDISIIETCRHVFIILGDLDTGDDIGGDISIIETCRHVFIILGDLDTGDDIGGDISIIETCRHVFIILGDLDTGDNIGGDISIIETCRHVFIILGDLDTGDDIGGDISIIETCRHVFIILGDLDTGDDIGGDISIIETCRHVFIILGDLDTGDNVIGGDIFIIETCRHVFIILGDLDTGDNVVYIPGDNDIGGEGRDFRTRLKEARYESYFENIDGVVKTDLVDFLKLDVQFHFNIPPGTDELLKDFRTKMTSSFRVILTHETMLPKMKEYIYPILKEIQPQLIISGHWHRAMHYLCDSCINDNSDSGHWPVHVRYLTHITDYIYLDLSNPQGIQEIMVPTCSYRMTDADIGYGVAIMNEDNSVKYTVLWLPLRYTYLMLYIIIFISLITFYILTKTCLPTLIQILYTLIRPSSKQI
ncbi:hypothetical protein LOTGIDRAFT_229698 [Lottia gigantea]|uniref:Calcineurin-like phosphoesterase domain-containing protein n=1 Tax=Lottia gigantea TaxID=225164 RepID=V3Z129_LOTGI|nr:hypothetical protein LOTGIDRAFT_229698 [Lottia gigantea]ESO84243.1 hypothetical protein LOTGIDRAFT_229698 [Lottia gigantea]